MKPLVLGSLLIVGFACLANAGESLSPQASQTQESSTERMVRLELVKSRAAWTEALERERIARELWDGGRHAEGLTKMLLAHRELCALGNSPEENPFDTGSAILLAQMYVENGEPNEAYILYRKVMQYRPPSELAERPDVVLAFADVCAGLKKDTESAAAFRRIANGDRFRTYFLAAESARGWQRMEDAERWFREALKIRPEDEKSKRGLRLIALLKSRGIHSTLG